LPPGVEMRIDGHALLSALRYELHKLRCSACGQIFTASLPDEAGQEKYSARARAVLVVGRYYLGLPFYRLQGYQAMLGVPMPDATQCDQIEKVGDYGYEGFEYLEALAAKGELFHQDDTSVRILTLIRCHCLAHGRRQFSDLEDVFPSECREVLDILTQVFDHDAEVRDQQMSAEARLTYHQASSGPLMDTLKEWLATQVEDRLVEPNSSLGQAMAYMQNHWQTLTQFLQIAGAPLDNNVVERALKLFIRQRNNSLF